MANKPVSYPVTEVLGFCDGISALLTNHKTAMIALGVDPTANLPRIGTKRDTLNTQNTEQEVMKTALRDKTPLVDAAKSDAYHEASQGADMLIAAFGNTSQVAKEARNLRKALQPKRRTTTTPATPPTT